MEENFRTCCRNDDINCILFLLNNYTFSQQTIIEGFLIACENGSLNIIEKIIEYGIYQYNIQLGLEIAAMNGNLKTIEKILECAKRNGIHLNIQKAIMAAEKRGLNIHNSIISVERRIKTGTVKKLPEISENEISKKRKNPYAQHDEYNKRGLYYWGNKSRRSRKKSKGSRKKSSRRSRKFV